MRVILLGTGAALVDPDRNHSSILITVRERNYLFDCAHGATHQLMRAGIDPVDINVIFLSHLHFDHIADFPYFMLSTWIFGRSVAPVVIGPPATENFVRHLFAEGAFTKDIEARAQYPQRQKNLHVLQPDVRECKPGLVFEDDLVSVTACYVEHIPREISPCFGLRMDTTDGESVVFSGDTSPCIGWSSWRRIAIFSFTNARSRSRQSTFAVKRASGPGHIPVRTISARSLLPPKPNRWSPPTSAISTRPIPCCENIWQGTCRLTSSGRSSWRRS